MLGGIEMDSTGLGQFHSDSKRSTGQHLEALLPPAASHQDGQEPFATRPGEGGQGQALGPERRSGGDDAAGDPVEPTMQCSPLYHKAWYLTNSRLTRKSNTTRAECWGPRSRDEKK